MTTLPRIYWEPALRDHLLVAPVFSVLRVEEGARMDLGHDFDAIVLKYGRPGALQGWDHRGRGLQEVRTLDFSTLPLDSTCPKWMEPAHHARLMQLVHSPQWVMVHASGGHVSKPMTGRWVFSDEAREYARLSQLPIVGEVTR